MITTTSSRHARRALTLRVAAAGALLSSALVTPATASPAMSSSATPEPDSDTRIMLVMDSSGSMGTVLPDGQTRMEAAQQSLGGVIDSLPDGTDVGLRVYGATEDSDTANDTVCADTQVVHPLGPLDRDALNAQVAELEPLGWTPIAHSLEQAAADLGSTGKRHIVLVSDGEETCTPDPCPEIRRIIDSGIDVQIDTIGFGVEEGARTQLQCISEAGGGIYYDAEDAASLTVALERVTTRALREFNVSGTRVEGVDRNNLGGAPTLTAGQYVDTIATGDQGIRYYQVEREHPQSRLTVSLTTRPPRSESASWETFRIDVVDTRANTCSYTQQDSRYGSGLTDFVVVSAVTRDRAYGDCLESDTLLLQVERRQGSQVPADVEIVVVEEPALASDRGLLPGLGNTPERPVSQETGSPSPVVGGAAFSNAPELEPGTYVDEIIPGEIVYYRVPIGWGQSSVLSVDRIVDDRYVGSGYQGEIEVLPRLYTPDRRNVTDDASDFVRRQSFRLDEAPTAHVMHVPSVRYLNRTESPRNVTEHHLAGDYYYALGVPTNKQGEAEGRPVPVQFTLSVTGEVTGEPDYLDTPLAAGADSPVDATDAAEATDGPDGSGATQAPDVAADVTDDAAATSAPAGGSDAAQETDDETAGTVSATDRSDGNVLLWVAGGVALLLVSFAGAAMLTALRRR